MAATWPFVGRQEELVLIAGAVHDQDVGGLVLAGPAGVGKTRLLHEALAVAGQDGFATRRAVATDATRALPFGALAPLLPAELPAASSRVNLLRLAAEALVAVAGRRRLVLGVDDAHLLDNLSAALVHQLVPAATAFMLVVVRSDEPAPDPITALWRNRLVERVDVQELLRPDVERVLVERLGGPVDGMLVERLWQESQGNPLMLRELVTAGEHARALRCVEGVWRWHGPPVLAPRLVELIEQRLGQLNPSERDVLEMLAHAEPVGPDLLSRLVSPNAVEAVEAKSLCWAEPSGRRMLVHLAHPVYGEVLRARTPVLRARRQQRQLASVLEQVGARRADDWLRVATWRLASGTASSPHVLLVAARRAWALLDLDLAERLARSALEAGGAWPAGEILWRVLMLHHRNDEAERLLAGLQDRPMSDPERGELAAARAYNLFWGLNHVDAGLAVIHHALGKTAEPPLRDRLQATQAEMLVHTGQYQIAERRAAELLARPGIQGIPAAQSHHVMGLTLLVHGQATRAVASFGRAAATPGWEVNEPWLGEAVGLWRCHALLLAGEFADAAAAAEASYQHALESGWDLAVGLALIGRGQVCRAHGQLHQSLRWLREGLGLVREAGTSGYLFGSVLLGEFAHTAALLADHASAQQALAEGDATRRRGLAIYHPWTDLARPWVSAAAGEQAAAVRQALQVAATARERGTPAYEIVALHDATRLGAASAAVGRLHELGHGNPSALIRCYTDHAAALADRDAPRLEQASSRLEGIGAHLLAAEAAAEACRAFQLAGRADSAHRAGARAAALAARCEGAATPSLRAIRAPDLTQREWAIIRLAADGLTDEDIAERLTVSIRTVHNHLHHAYTKLGIHSRTELAPVLEAQPHPRGEKPPFRPGPT